MKPIIITGATSAIGRAIARELASQGYPLVLCALDKDTLTPVVTDIESRYGVKCMGSLFNANETDKHDELIKKIKKVHHEVDGIILTHGYMTKDDSINTSASELDNLVRINFESVMSILGAYARYYKHKSFACVITSIAGDRGKARNLGYNAVKAAASVYLQGFEQAAPHISVIEIKPGFVDTPMTYGSIDSPLVSSREKVAHDIVRAIKKKKRMLYTPFFWRYIMLILKHMPRFIFNRLKL